VLRTFLRLGPAGWRDLVEAQIWILLSLWTVRRQPRGGLVHNAGRLSRDGTAGPRPGSDAQATEAASLEEVATLARAVDRVSRLGLGRPLCLARSMALHRMLERRGIQGSRIRVGVRGGEGEFEAHAWVEWQGHVLGEQPGNVDSYRPMDELVVGPAAPPLRTEGTGSGVEMTQR